MAVVPCGHRVLVRPDEVSERRGVLYVPQTSRDREQMAQVFGTIIAVGPTAWKAFDDGKPWAVVGDRVSYAKYGGFVIEDPATKEHYRLLNDEDIIAVVTGTYELREEAI
jgi:co-chaperonin GroES (HSP10)